MERFCFLLCEECDNWKYLIIWLFDYFIFSNLPNLQSFITGDNSFHETTSLSLSSMIIKFDYLTFSNLPNLQSFKTGYKSFYKTTSLSLSSMIINMYYLTFQIFLIYNHSKQEEDHSIIQQVYLYQVIILNSQFTRYSFYKWRL